MGVGLNVAVYSAVSGLLFDMDLAGAPPDARLVATGREVCSPNYVDLQSASGAAGATLSLIDRL